jgi:hypothetical protein
MKTVFYAWQSDLPNSTNRSFLEQCLQVAIANANGGRAPNDRLILDKDTQGVSGLPVIADVVLGKIETCAVFVPDLSFINPAGTDRPVPNPNVLIELGYALGKISDRRIVGLFNTAFGDTHDLPFDLRNRRFPLSYQLGEGDSSEVRAAVREKLTKRLTEALIKAAQYAPNEPETAENDPTPSHAVQPLQAPQFFAEGPIARTKSLDERGTPNEYVYWHQNPSAWLRVIPLVPAAYKRAELAQHVATSPAPLQPFGSAQSQRTVPNDLGVVVLGFDGPEPEPIATRLSQVFLSGEIWGLNRILVEPRRTEPMRTFQIPWPGTAVTFESSLRNYLQFAAHSLRLDLPVIVVVGLAAVRDAVLIREKGAWSTETPRDVRCFEHLICRYWEVKDWDVDVAALLKPFYEAIGDACGLDFSTEPSTYTWPR